MKIQWLALAVLGLASVAQAAEEPVWQDGPKQIDLGHELDLALPAEYAYLGMPDADRLLQKAGSLHNENCLGVIAPKDVQQNWFVVIRYEDEGYIKDDEKIDADDLLKSIREGTAEANQERVAKGLNALTIDGWSQPPRYERDVHHLVWALLVSSAHGQSVNFNTRMLGRKGYASLNLVTDPDKLTVDRQHADTLLDVTRFRDGARYEDYKHGDRVASYGLIGLILGGAGVAKLVKLGILATFWKSFLALLIAGKKALLLAFVAIGGFFKRLFGKKDDTAPPGP